MPCIRCKRQVRDVAQHLKLCKVCKCGYHATNGEDLFQHRLKVHPVNVVMFTR